MTDLPLTGREFYDKLRAMGLLPENLQVSSITIYVNRECDLVQMTVEGVPAADITEALVCE